MNNKKKLYQVLADGPDQGQIKELSQLASEEGVTYLVFTDGTRCNIAFVGKLNDSKAYDSGMYVGEVIDRTNIWKFNKKVEGPEDRQLFSEDAGQWFTGADPYHQDNKQRTITEAIPPKRVVSEDEIKTSKEKLRELGFDENTPGFEQSNGLIIDNQEELSRMQAMAQLKGVGYKGGVKGLRPTEIAEGTTLGLDPDFILPPTPKDLAKYQHANEIYIPENLGDVINEASTPAALDQAAQDVVSIASEGLPTPGLPPSSASINSAPVEEVTPSGEKKTSHEGSPVWSIVSKCKKKECQAPLILNLALPGKSIYNLIKDEYEDDVVEEFFDILIDTISTDQIKASLKEALRASYEGKKEATE